MKSGVEFSLVLPRSNVAHSIVACVVCALSVSVPHAASATDVDVVGLFPNKAVIMVNGAGPRTIDIGGKTPDGVKLIGVNQGAATLEIDGKRHRVPMGQGITSASGGDSGSAAATLTADGRGHFVTVGSVNGAAVRFLVDTGATVVSLGSSDAMRAGIDYRKGQRGTTMTANGPAQVWRVRLSNVRIGDVTLNDVEGAVLASDLPVALLGMSFLNRMEMTRDGGTMTLRKRY